jgi:uncharacterized Fe-S cluster protein YjdI
MENSITKKYSNDDITIVWKPNVCIHSTLCWKGEKGLSDVFNPSKKPWIKPDGASTSEIIKRIDNCPSAALSYFKNTETDQNMESESERIAEIMENGPLLVYGNITVKDKDGHETKKSKVTAFCRCGQSGNKPYCDGAHQKVGFKG